VRRGAALFNAGLFFECHELFEDAWRASAPPERLFYHGLVQAAAACYHAEKGNTHGAAVLLDKARAKLTRYAPRYLGVDIEGLLASLRAVRDGTSAGGYRGSRPVMPLV
jgi:predicted metal-dependent hydrolase